VKKREQGGGRRNQRATVRRELSHDYIRKFKPKRGELGGKIENHTEIIICKRRSFETRSLGAYEKIRGDGTPGCRLKEVKRLKQNAT